MQTTPAEASLVRIDEGDNYRLRTVQPFWRILGLADGDDPVIKGMSNFMVFLIYIFVVNKLI